MLKIYDGRDYFYQWDRGQRLIIDDPSVSEVNFCNGTLDCSLSVEVYDEEGLRLANVPDVLLQTDKAINVFSVIKSDETTSTRRCQKFYVKRRTKPEDYKDSPVLQDKEITENGEYTPDADCDGFGKVSVNVPIPDGYIEPTGSCKITKNGEYNIAAFETVEIAVPDEAVPPEITTEEEIDALPTGAVFAWAGGESAAYETGALYIVCDE